MLFFKVIILYFRVGRRIEVYVVYKEVMKFVYVKLWGWYWDFMFFFIRLLVGNLIL